MDSQGGLWNMNTPDWGAWLRTLREAKGLSQTDLATKVGIANTTLSDMERGVRGCPGGVTLVKLALALGISVDYLMMPEFPSDEGRGEYKADYPLKSKYYDELDDETQRQVDIAVKTFEEEFSRNLLERKQHK